MRGCHEPPESVARGTLSEGFPRNLGELPVSCGIQQVLVIEGNQRWREWAVEQSYEPIVPMKVANRRATLAVAATGATGGKGETNQHNG